MDIRKISVGANYKEAMHYIVGQDILAGKYKLHHIKHHPETESLRIYILKEEEIFLWKEFNKNMPISIEFNINF